MNSFCKTLIALIFLTLFSTTSILGQTKEDQKLLYKTGNPADWPQDQDAVVSAPDNHKILLENDKVRVLEVTLSPNELEPVHHHQWPSVLYIMEAGDFIDRDGVGNVIFDSRQLPEPLKFPMTMWKAPEAPHSVENLSDSKTIRLIRVELKDADQQLKTHPGNVSVIDGIYKAFAVGDMPAVLGSLDSMVVWNEAEGNVYADGNPYIGPDAVLNGVFARIGADYEYFKLKDIHLHEMVNNQVLATLRYDAKLKKNGALIDAQVAHLWTLKDSKVSTFQQYVDTKQLDMALKK